MTNFERFRNLVFQDDSLRDRLLAETNLHAFCELLIDLANHRGFAITEEQLRTEFQLANRSWIERRLR